MPNGSDAGQMVNTCGEVSCSLESNYIYSLTICTLGAPLLNSWQWMYSHRIGRRQLLIISVKSCCSECDALRQYMHIRMIYSMQRCD